MKVLTICHGNICRSVGAQYILQDMVKFRYPSCSSVGQLKEKNKKVVTESRDQIINEDYQPCKRCNP